MLIKNLIDEDFVNYKKPAMFIGTCKCDFKCFKELKLPIEKCANYELSNSKNIYMGNKNIVNRYMNNIYTEAIVIGGMEPFLQFDDLISLIAEFRSQTNDVIIIYTGYYKEEVEDKIDKLKIHKNIIVKFGRYVPNDEETYDDVLGIYLASSNQYAERIS